VPRIGLFGGSFDPVHSGHLLVAQAAFEELDLTRLYFVPAARSPFKPEHETAPAALRLAMLRLGLAGEPAYAVDDQELGRGGVSYTIDTVRTYAGRFPGAELFYLIGADHVAKLAQWREAAELAALVQFVVIPRPGQPPVLPPPSFRIRALAGFPMAVSSSQIRNRVKAGASIRNLVPPAVAEFLHNNRLYL
jgi:nicotinate-nucleotide adenylyltransferase